MHSGGLTRRRFMQWSALGICSLAMPHQGLAALRRVAPHGRSLCLYNAHSGEELETTYWAKGEYLPEALNDVNQIMRDHRTGEIESIDVRLLDLLHAMGLVLDPQEPYHIISGYRSPKTNALLRRHSKGVASKSLHMCGRAVDIHLPGCELSLLRRVALDLRAGGVGYYPGPNFVHVDVGRVRCW